MYNQIKTKFDTKVIKAQYCKNESLMTYFSLKLTKSNIGKINLEVLQALLDMLQLYQRALGLGYISENQLIATTQTVYRGVFKLKFVLFTFAITFKKLCFKLQLSIIAHINRNSTHI